MSDEWAAGEWTLDEDARRDVDAMLDELMADSGDSGPVLAADDGPLGPRRWTPGHVYCAVVSARRLVRMPRHPPPDTPLLDEDARRAILLTGLHLGLRPAPRH